MTCAVGGRGLVGVGGREWGLAIMIAQKGQFGLVVVGY